MPGAAGAPDAETIMARVAANQDRSEMERLHFVYVQHARVTSRKGGTVRCEETTDSRVTPSADGSHQELLKLEGRLLVKGKYVEYTALPRVAMQGGSTTTSHDDDVSINLGDDEMDREMVESMRSKLTDRRSKDGIAAGLFPLTSKMQAEYKVQLLGREPVNGRQTFHIGFEPKEKSDSDWKGEVYVDVDAFEPVLIRTKLFHNIPGSSAYAAGDERAGSMIYGDLCSADGRGVVPGELWDGVQGAGAVLLSPRGDGECGEPGVRENPCKFDDCCDCAVRDLRGGLSRRMVLGIIG